MTPRRLLGLLPLLPTLWAGAAAAAPTSYTAQANAYNYCLTDSQIGAAPTSASLDCNVIGGSGPTYFGQVSSRARADAGELGVGARASSSGSYVAVAGGAYAAIEGLPVTFSWVGPGPAPTGLFSASLNLELDGEMGTESLSFPNASGVELIFQAFLGNGSSLGLYRYAELANGIVQRSPNFAAISGIEAEGSVVRRVFDLDFTTAPFQFTLGAPVELMLSLTVGVTGSQNIASVSWADFMNTASFARGRPVFNLPDGFTADAGDLIVGNRFGGTSTPVPEPGALALLLAGLWLIRRLRS